MSALRHPVGPQPPRVYWLRRLIVVVLAVVLVAAAFLVGKAVLGRSGTGGDAVADPAAQTSADPSVEPSPSESATGPAACGPETVSITLTADQRTYAAGAQPVFTVTITNTSNASCKIEAGEAKPGGPGQVRQRPDLVLAGLPGRRQPVAPAAAAGRCARRDGSDLVARSGRPRAAPPSRRRRSPAPTRRWRPWPAWRAPRRCSTSSSRVRPAAGGAGDVRRSARGSRTPRGATGPRARLGPAALRRRRRSSAPRCRPRAAAAARRSGSPGGR